MRKDASPQQIAAWAAAIVGLAFLLVIALMGLIWSAWHPWYIYLSGLIIMGGGSGLVFYFLLNRFIYEKIRLIYKTIHDVKMPRGSRRDRAPATTMIKQAKEDVADWASSRDREIEQLKKLEAYRRDFLGNVSHELKTPIFNIQGYVLTLLDGGLDDPKVNRHYLMRTEQSINRMISIVEDLETISRLESGEASLRTEAFDLASLVREVFEMTERDAAAKGIRLRFAQAYDSPVMVSADRKRIQQVITNLTVNAVKYGSEGGFVKVSFFDMDKHILTEVTDSGIGIPREELPRIFERFFRGEKSRTRNHGEGGSGLGLAIVKHIIEAHQQTIHVRSTQGVGTTFAFTLKKAGKSGH